jgi:hypothetical protein
MRGLDRKNANEHDHLFYRNFSGKAKGIHAERPLVKRKDKK